MKTVEKYICCILCGLFPYLGANEAWAGWQVWTITQTQRVLRDEPASIGASVRIAAARNEWESFQILMRSDTPIKVIDICPSDLRGPGDAILPASNVRLYREHQLRITTETRRMKGFSSPWQFKPGWYPDPLIPFKHPLTQKPLTKARFSAVPFDLPVGQTHGFWVDVYIPPETRPGEYRGTFRIVAENEKVVDIPVILEVWDFTLPNFSTLRTSFGSPAARIKKHYRQRASLKREYELINWNAVETQCAEMLARHRINPAPPLGILAPKAMPDGSYRVSSAQIRKFREFADRYHVNAIQIHTHPLGIVKDPEKQRRKLYAWLKSWDRAAAELNRPHVLFYLYLIDEPNNEEEYRFVQKWGKVIRQANSVLKIVVTEQTWPQKKDWGNLYGAVDIWCPTFFLFNPESAAKRQALGETIWTYTALAQRKPTPWWQIDHPLLNYRVPAWISWRYRIRGLLYWGEMSYWDEIDDPWTEPWTFGRKSKIIELFNGEGTLVYPGRDVGYDGIVPSMRLKTLRDSVEDYEYLAILERKGLAEEAQKLVMPLAGSWFDWEMDPAAYEKARASLAEMIVTAGK